MNRRGFFGALMGGIAAATGLRSLVRLPALRIGGHIHGARVDARMPPAEVVLLKGACTGKTEDLLDFVGDAVALPGTALWRTTPAPWLAPAFPTAFDASGADAPAPATPSVSTVPVDLPEVWPGPSGAITATAALPPLAQVECLVDLFGASGDAAPSFAAALIGELVLTRLRLADLRRLYAPSEPAMAPAPVRSPEGIPS